MLIFWYRSLLALFLLLLLLSTTTKPAGAWLHSPIFKSLVKAAHDTLTWIVPPTADEVEQERQQRQHYHHPHKQEVLDQSKPQQLFHRHYELANPPKPSELFLEAEYQQQLLLHNNHNKHPSKPKRRRQKKQELEEKSNIDATNIAWTQAWDRAISLYGTISKTNEQQQESSLSFVLLSDLTDLIVALGQCRKRVLTTHQVSWFQGTLDAMEAQHQVFLFYNKSPKQQENDTEDVKELLVRAAQLIQEAMSRPNIDHDHVQDLVHAYVKVKARYEKEQQAVQRKQPPAIPSLTTTPWMQQDDILALLLNMQQQETKVEPQSLHAAQKLEEAILSSILADDDDNISPTVEFFVDSPTTLSKYHSKTAPSDSNNTHFGQAPHLTVHWNNQEMTLSFLSNLDLTRRWKEVLLESANDYTRAMPPSSAPQSINDMTATKVNNPKKKNEPM